MLKKLETTYNDLFSRVVAILCISIWELTLFYIIIFILTIKTGL